MRVLDVRDRAGLRALLAQERPDEIYNLASWSSVGLSWAHPWQVTEVNGLAVLGLLEEVLTLRNSTGYDPRICQASSSEMFGLVRELPQNEGVPASPALALRDRQVVRPPHGSQLQGVLRNLRRDHHPVQPRESPAPTNVRHAQDHLRRRGHRPRQAGVADSREDGRPSGLGLRGGLRGGNALRAGGG